MKTTSSGCEDSNTRNYLRCVLIVPKGKKVEGTFFEKSRPSRRIKNIRARRHVARHKKTFHVFKRCRTKSNARLPRAVISPRARFVAAETWASRDFGPRRRISARRPRRSAEATARWSPGSRGTPRTTTGTPNPRSAVTPRRSAKSFGHPRRRRFRASNPRPPPTRSRSPEGSDDQAHAAAVPVSPLRPRSTRSRCGRAATAPAGDRRRTRPRTDARAPPSEKPRAPVPSRTRRL